MGKASKALKEFIENIPDAKLTGFSTAPGTIYKTTEFRLDMQGVRGSSLDFARVGQLDSLTLIGLVTVWPLDDCQ